LLQFLLLVLLLFSIPFLQLFLLPFSHYTSVAHTTQQAMSFPLQFDWNVTRNENMADISGLQIAYSAWRLLQEGESADPLLPGLNLNTRQLFFLSAAQVNVHDDFTHRRSDAMIRTSPWPCPIFAWKMLCRLHSSQDEYTNFLIPVP
jgi:hypothetical protein